MDTLKIPKGSSSASKTSGSVPITVRFNAGEESLDDIFQSFHNKGCGGGSGGGGGGGGAGDSLSSSPQTQNPDDVNTRNNFLQGNFFNRKRSDSSDGMSPSSAGQNLIAALSTNEQVGTWKIIKGKVSQKIEDIKSSKGNSNPVSIGKGDVNDPGSDYENLVASSSMSDEISLDQEFKMLNKCDSDSEIESDILLVPQEVERLRLRRSLANFKSKATKSKPQSIVINQSTSSSSSVCVAKNDTSPIQSTTTSTIRNTFLRKRRKSPAPDTIEQSAAPTSLVPNKTEKKKGIIPGRKEYEIESGVEMLEDMIPPPSTNVVSKSTDADDDNNKNTNIDKRRDMELPIIGSGEDDSTVKKTIEKEVISSSDSTQSQTIFQGCEANLSFNNFSPHQEYFRKFHDYIKRIPYISITILTIVLLLPTIPDFVRGVLSCWLTISILDWTWGQLKSTLEAYITADGPEKIKFEMPNYSKMSICEVPAVEEHKTVKTYSGWMNEINNYDPSNFHISMTKSVYIKLDGSILRLSNTTARIPKRIMWNEPPIDRKTVSFTRHRTFNLVGCRVEMCPRGLARKRYFSRKYPIQLIVKNSDDTRKSGDQSASTTSLNLNKRSSVSTNGGKEDDKKSTITAALDVKNFDTMNSSISCGAEKSDKKNSTESLDYKNEAFEDDENNLDFSATIMNADLQVLQNETTEIKRKYSAVVPCGDETRILLFARSDREKEDWYRRFVSASNGAITDQDLHIPNIYMVSDLEIQAAIKATSLLPELAPKENDATTVTNVTIGSQNSDDGKSVTVVNNSPIAGVEKAEKTSETKPKTPDAEKSIVDDDDISPKRDSTFEGLLISSSAARNPIEYIRFMALYQNACSQKTIPVFKITKKSSEKKSKRNRRGKQQEDELWKGIDQSLYLGPSGSVVWANVLIGRILFSCLTDAILLEKIQDFLQKKLSAIKLPSFMEDVSITQIFLGDTPPLIHRVSQPLLDERGTWIDADVTYEGLMHMTITTKLNLLRLKQQKKSVAGGGVDISGGGTGGDILLSSSLTVPVDIINNDLSSFHQTDQLIDEDLANCAIYDSNAESTGASSSESESPTVGSVETNATDSQFFNSSPGNARRLFKIVDRITASNLFQYATELSYVQRAMENMSTNITLRVELKGLVSRIAINIPPPPSDRIWFSFRGPPRLWITAKPALGDHTFDWSIVTNVIESKLCEEVYKYLVYPNMIDVMVSFLGQSTYKE